MMNRALSGMAFGVALLVGFGLDTSVAETVSHACLEGPATATCFRPDIVRVGAAPHPTLAVVAEVTETDTVPGAPDVSLSFQALFQSDSRELVSKIVMNVDPEISPAALTFTQTAGPAVKRIGAKYQNGRKLAPESGFDLEFRFKTAKEEGEAWRFNEHDVATFTISCAGDPDCAHFGATSFDFLTEGDFRIGVFVRGIERSPCLENGLPTGRNCTSGRVFGGQVPAPARAAPEPATLVLLGCGVIAVGVVRGQQAARSRKAA